MRMLRKLVPRVTSSEGISSKYSVGCMNQGSLKAPVAFTASGISSACS